MGKNQHSKDRLFVTRTEQESLYGGKRGLSARETGAQLAAAKAAELPLTHCALSLQPWENPVCTPDGTVFELLNVLPYVRKFKVHPVTGEPLQSKDLTRLVFARNSGGELHCPVLFKTFNKSSHVVAIRTTGNVFSYDAVKELNLKAKNMTDLLTGEKFDKKDILTLSDPKNLNLRRIADAKVRERALEEKRKSGASVRLDDTAARALVSANGNSSLVEANARLNISAPKVVGAKKGSGADKTSKVYTTGRAAAGFTSTTLNPVTENEMRALTEDEERQERYKRVKKKGYAQIVTNFGALNAELHCDQTPRTCENFIGLALKKYYDGVKFHRSIPRFMLQGGDPTGTGRGGESLWGEKFPDEIRGSLRHKGKGVLSMANSGLNTNGSQFFVTYASASHLDNKHTVFGHIVGGIDVLERIERVPTDDKDRPEEDVVIEKVKVLVNPFADSEKEKKKAEEAEAEKKAKEEADRKRDRMYSSAGGEGSNEVGKYVGRVGGGEVDTEYGAGGSGSRRLKCSGKKAKYGDFSSW
mmetsp:Transcript_10590/g.32411  ORF Transcript_10590/g.32411 Transcript_10590/m.32411 type:complete len:529 (+) Transcript_10590:52-1638(+)|eukprot:CAMPEP_0198734000 /NCGR_PEP_ID=MMETSP1475-20131203/49748_1 /TAXON_ID= ORGANISM="Unidentified sp., Strain CCMP1999" /NCGR_SAMPLE_ID=MMETSP1475 /ASSEMBLY_ACC=CAM_ASM_001111 /LENGTH=528 /DNA_ID=CAMNT_0044497399 /DNA_START=35 /DNA_END=1621 /DNA_ORIENTATION=-